MFLLMRCCKLCANFHSLIVWNCILHYILGAVTLNSIILNFNYVTFKNVFYFLLSLLITLVQFDAFGLRSLCLASIFEVRLWAFMDGILYMWTFVHLNKQPTNMTVIFWKMPLKNTFTTICFDVLFQRVCALDHIEYSFMLRLLLSKYSNINFVLPNAPWIKTKFHMHECISRNTPHWIGSVFRVAFFQFNSDKFHVHFNLLNK